MPKKPPFIPQWEGAIEGWTVNYANDQLWRVSPVLDTDDLYQQGYVIFCRCKARYKNLEDPQHFMALYKTSFTNFVHDMSKKRTGDQAVKLDYENRLRSSLLDQSKELKEIDDEL